ncbi:MAG: SusC/RagA family TonB-linked outer membrane protein [Prevotella sp.]|jgi:TonB-linked SusC/RagA family outer membrane protein|nr:SusC/RagA family TonB-linked outer membrane protein [Prevotella sp.]
MKKLTIIILFLFLGIGLAFAQTRSISGIVVDEAGAPLTGVAVSVKGSVIGTITGADGKFTLSVPQNVKNLTFSFIGYETREVAPTAGMKVLMKSTENQLEEVVVTGITRTDKRLFTGATDRLSADKMMLSGVADISRSLEGRSAGVSVQNVSGTFGAAPKIRVRGATSIYGNSKPLWVVDGVIMDDIVDVSADNLSSGDAVTLISSAIAGLNADDIESFQILKDGSATSIYGARAMSGVIVVTTKKGRPGISKISYTGEFTTRLVPDYNNFNIMNSQEQMGVYKELRDKGWLNMADIARKSESGVYGKMYQLINTYDEATGLPLLRNTEEARNAYLRSAEMRNTDWFDILFSQGISQNHSVSMTTGTDKSSMYVSLSAMNDPGWYIKSKTQRYTANLNATQNISNTVSANMIANASYRKQEAPGTLGQSVDVVNGAVKRDFDINPYSYALNSSRALDPNAYYTSNYAPFNILKELDNNNIDLNVVDLKFQGELKWKILPELEVSALGALKYKTTSQEHRIKDNSNQAMAYRAMDDATIMDRNPFLYTDPDFPYALPITVLPQGGIYQRTDYKMLAYDFRASVFYNKMFDQKHIVNFTGGMEVNSVDRQQSFFNGWGLQYEMGEIPFYVYQYFKKAIEGNTDYYSMETTRNRSAAYFANATYSYAGKYIVSGTYRYEGSNRLGKSRNSRWLPTWNISGAWNAHEESFFEKLQPALSHLTLKTSYSLTAENPPGSVTNSLPIYQSYKPFRPSTDVVESGLFISNIENSELTYEKKHEFNIGADVGFLDNRINVAADWYTRNNYDLIGIINTQGIGGGANDGIYKMANIATMRSKGIELSISTKNIKTKDFSWNTDLVFSHNKTEVTELEANTRIIDLVSGNGFAMQGYPNRGIFSFRFNGLNESGIPTIVDSKGNNIDPEDIDFQKTDNVLDIIKYEGSSEPTVNGGFGNIFHYGNFHLNVFLTYAFGNKIRLDPVFKTAYTDLTSMPKEFANRWTLPGDEKITSIPVILSVREEHSNTYYSYLYNAFNYSDARVVDGGFIRMKEISLSYDLPKRWIGKICESASLKLQGTNLFLIYADSRLNGQDPEFFRSGGVSAPVPKQYTLTVRIGF